MVCLLLSGLSVHLPARLYVCLFVSSVNFRFVAFSWFSFYLHKTLCAHTIIHSDIIRFRNIRGTSFSTAVDNPSP